jgi:hypothetical protein
MSFMFSVNLGRSATHFLFVARGSLKPTLFPISRPARCVRLAVEAGIQGPEIPPDIAGSDWFGWLDHTFAREVRAVAHQFRWLR